MTQRLEIIHGSPFALRRDGAGHCPVDNSFAEEWVTVLKLIGDQYEPLRRFASAAEGLAYVSLQLKATREHIEAQEL